MVLGMFGGLLYWGIPAFLLGVMVSRRLHTTGAKPARCPEAAIRAVDRVVDRLSEREKLGVLLASLPSPVVEHYLESLSSEQASEVVRMLARYRGCKNSECDPNDVGERLLQRVAIDILAQLSRDVPDLVAQLIFNPDPPPEPNPGTDQVLHILGRHIGQDFDFEGHLLDRRPRTSS